MELCSFCINRNNSGAMHAYLLQYAMVASPYCSNCLRGNGVLIEISSIKTTYPTGGRRKGERFLLWQMAINMSLTLVICYVGFYLFNASGKNIMYYMPAAAILTAIIMATVKRRIAKNRQEADKRLNIMNTNKTLNISKARLKTGFVFFLCLF